MKSVKQYFPKQIPKLNETRASIKESLEKHKGEIHLSADPEMAIEVMEEASHEHNEIEQALIAEHVFRKTIENSIPVGIAGFDEKWRLIYVNRVFCIMVGWQAEELNGSRFPHPFWLLPPEHSPGQSDKTLKRLISQSNSFEIQFKKKSGKAFWGLVFSNVLSDSTGKSIGRLISVSDISAQKKAEDIQRLLTTKLINAQERERKLIARDIHDSIGGKLTGIKYALENILTEFGTHSNDEHRNKLQKTINALRMTLEESQRITKNLHPAILDDLGLFAAIRENMREFKSFYPAMNVIVDFQIEENIIPDSYKILIYRVIQEALNNVGKHSMAQNVTVSIAKKSQHIDLLIKDDGKGFDITQKPTKEAYGLDSMQERTKTFGGTLDILSQPGKYTCIKASWPLAIYNK